MALNLGRFIRDRKRDIEDVFSANTQRDQQKRIAAGQPRFYADQQRQQRPAPTQYGRPQQFQPPTVGPPQQRRPSPLGNITQPDITAPTEQLRQQAQINPTHPKSDVFNKTVDTLENVGRGISNLTPQNQVINRFKAVNQVARDPNMAPKERSARLKELSRPRAIVEDLVPGGAMGADMLREVGPRGGARILETLAQNKVTKNVPIFPGVSPNASQLAGAVRNAQKTGVGKFILGDKPIETSEKDLQNMVGNTPVLKDLAKFGPVAFGAGVAMNVPGVGGLDDAGKAAKAISQANNVEDVAKVVAATPDLEKVISNVDDAKKAQVLEDLAKETDPNNVKKIVQEANNDKPKVTFKQPDPLESLKQEAKPATGARSDYSPENLQANRQIRAKNASSITYADKKTINPDELVTVYRAVPGKAKGGLVEGDWVTPNKEQARLFMKQSWAQDDTGAKIVTKKVKASELRYHADDAKGYVDDELLYVPKATQSQPPKPSPTALQEAAQDTGKPKVAFKQPEDKVFGQDGKAWQDYNERYSGIDLRTARTQEEFDAVSKGRPELFDYTPDGKRLRDIIDGTKRVGYVDNQAYDEMFAGLAKQNGLYTKEMNGVVVAGRNKADVDKYVDAVTSGKGLTKQEEFNLIGYKPENYGVAPKLEKLTPEQAANQGVPEVPEQFRVDAGDARPAAGSDNPVVMSGGGRSNVPDAVKPAVETPSGKTRGFTKNMVKTNATEGNTTAQAVIEAMPGYKPIKNRNTLGRAAKAINDNPTQVYADIATKAQLTTADDIAKGNLLLRAAVESGDVEAAIQIGTKLGVDGTKLGQAIQAYSMWKRTTPEGIVRFASKKAAGAGRELDPAITQELISMAQKIQAMPESLEKAKATRELLNQAEGVGRTWKDTVQEIISSPRSIMASADLSAPLRQGAVLGSRYPGEFAKNFGESVKYFFSPGAFEKSMYEISQRPTYNLMKSHKLAVGGASGLTGTEEQFMKSILEGKTAKKLGVGHLVAASDRAYTGFLTKFRADVFDSIVTQSEKAGVQLDKKSLDSLAKFVNSASGRGSGKNLDRYGGLLSQALFSPKLWKSRIDTLNPAYYARLDPAARKLALQSATSFAAITGTILGLAKLAGADVETDPRSADFAKVKVGNTRYDILGGHQQQARFAAQMITGQKINSETGEMQTLGPDRGFGKPSRLDLAYQFVENKENPVVGFATKALRGTDPAGNKINIASEAAKLGIPLTFQGTWDTAKDQGSLAKGVAMNVPGTFGVGVQTYGSKKNGNKLAGDSYKDGSGLEGKDIAYKDFKDKAKDGSLVRLDDGKYAVKIGDKVSTADNLKDIYTKINKKELNDSGMAYKVVGETVYRQGANGKVTATPKIKFDYEMGSATLTKQKRAGDFEGWNKTADSQLDNIAKQLDDPLIDPLEAIKLQNQAESLLEQKSKYAGYGGFKKGSGGSGGGRRGGGGGRNSVGDPYKYAVDLNSGGGRKINTTVSVKAPAKPKVAKKGGGKPKVTLKKSKV